MPDINTRKRQYLPANQTTLHNYTTQDGHPRKLHSPKLTPLSEDIQSSLLSVGMRVRKSVPEGYKTHKTLASSAYLCPSSAPSAPLAAVAPPNRTNTSTLNNRELQPFCGLHKTGGWGVQNMPHSSAPAAMRRAHGVGEDDDHDHDHEDDMSGLAMSQGTISSTPNILPGLPRLPTQAFSTKKRCYEDEIEDDRDAFFDEGEAVDTATTQKPVRPLAKTKASSRKHIDNVVHIFGTNDFEEPPFLLPIDADA